MTRLWLAACLAACAAPPGGHAGPVTGVTTVGGLQFSCSQAGLFVGAGDSATFVAELPLRPFALAGHPGDERREPFLLVAGGDPGRSGELALVDLRGRLRAQATVATDLVYAVAIAPDGNEAAAALADGRVLFVQLPALAPVHELHRHARAANAVAYAPDGLTLASGGQDGKLLLATTRDARPPLPIVDHTAAVTCLAFAPDGSLLASGAGDAKVRLHDRNGLLLHTWQRLGGPIAEVWFRDGAVEFSTRIGPGRDAVLGRLRLP